jgi:hypothetical protein
MEKVFDKENCIYNFCIAVGSVLGRTMNEKLMSAIASPAPV